MLRLVLLAALCTPSILAKPTGDCFFFCNEAPKMGRLMQQPMQQSMQQPMQQPMQQGSYYQAQGGYGGPGMGQMGQMGGRLESFDAVPVHGQPTYGRMEQMPLTGEALFVHSASSNSQSNTHGYVRFPVVGQMPVHMPSEPLVQYPGRPCAANYVSSC